MATRRSEQGTFGTTVRLAMVVSTVAAVLTLVLEAIGDVSPTAMVLSVAVVGFTASWVQTGKVIRDSPPGALMPVRQPVN